MSDGKIGSGSLQNQRPFMLHLCIGIAFSAIFLVVFLQKIDIRYVLSSYANLSLINGFWVIGATGLHVILKAIRWRMIISPVKNVTLKSALSNIMVGLMANNILPSRLGEVLRITSFSSSEKIRASAVFSALIFERILDGTSMILLFMVASFFLPNSFMPTMKKTALVITIVYLCALVLLALFLKLGNHFQSEKRIMKPLVFILNKAAGLHDGLAILKNTGGILGVCLLSLGIWLSASLITLSTATLFIKVQPDIFKHLKFINCIFLNGAVSLAAVMPSAPGYIGTFHVVCAFILCQIGFSQVFSKSLAIFLHGSQYLLTTLIGLVLFFKKHSDIRSLLRIKL